MLQRFCPLCDRAFEDGEAVLRCTGCGLLHHPGCWVGHNGCANDQPHQSAPQAMAYGRGERPPGAPAPHPGEGTRFAAASPEPLPFRRPPDEDPRPESAEPAIATTFVRRQLPEDIAPPIGSGPRRFHHSREEPLPRKPLPRIYRRHRWLGYWYLPVALLLAIGVAFAIVWAADRLTSDDSMSSRPSPTPLAGTAPTPTPTSPAFSTTAPATTSTAPAPSVPATVGPGRFSAGQRLVVRGTGDCLNVRTNPGTENDAIVCLQDGAEVRVIGGPEVAGTFTWWKIQTALGAGWAVENYLTPEP